MDVSQLKALHLICASLALLLKLAPIPEPANSASTSPILQAHQQPRTHDHRDPEQPRRAEGRGRHPTPSPSTVLTSPSVPKAIACILTHDLACPRTQSIAFFWSAACRVWSHGLSFNGKVWHPGFALLRSMRRTGCRCAALHCTIQSSNQRECLAPWLPCGRPRGCCIVQRLGTDIE